MELARSRVSLGVVIVHFEELTLLEQCLASLRDSSVSPDKIVVIDNSTPQISKAAARLVLDMEHVTHRTMPGNVGFAQAVNAGLEELADCEIVILVNQDTIADFACVGDLVDYLGNNPHVGAASPLILNDAGRVWFAGGLFNHWRGRVDLVDFAKSPGQYRSGPSPFVSGCFLAVRAEAYHDIGPFNPDIFLYYEDVEWCCRAQSSLWETHLVPNAVVHHRRGIHGDADRNLSPVMLRHETAGRLRFVRGYLSGLQRVVALAYTTVILARRSYLVARAHHPSMRDQFTALAAGVKDGLSKPALRPPSQPPSERSR